MIEIVTADCLKWLPTLPEGSADLALADPYYNIKLEYGDGSPPDNLQPWQYLAWCRAWISACHTVLRPGGWLYIIVSPHFGPELGVIARESGFARQQLVWRERFGSYFQDRWAYEHRSIFACHKPGGARVFNADSIRVPSRRQEMGDPRADPRGRVPGDVWDFARVCGTFKERVPGVPTQLPEALVERIVLAHTDPGDLIVDPFCGSGTTAAVCQRHARRCLTCDINPDYTDIAKRRLGL